MKAFLKWVFIIIILALLIVFTINFAEEELDKNLQEDIKTEMLQVQAKSKIVFEKYHIDNENGLKGEKVEDESLKEKYSIDDLENFYKWSRDVLAEEGIKDIALQEDEYYLVNYDTEEVIYSEGYKNIDGNTYYKLSEIVNLDSEKINEKQGEEIKDEGEGDSQNKETEGN